MYACAHCFNQETRGSLNSGAIWSTDRVCCARLRGGQASPLFSGGWHIRDRVPDRSTPAIPTLSPVPRDHRRGRFIGTEVDGLGHRRSMPTCRGQKAGRAHPLRCGAPSWLSLVTSGRCARPTSQRGSLQASSSGVPDRTGMLCRGLRPTHRSAHVTAVPRIADSPHSPRIHVTAPSYHPAPWHAESGEILEHAVHAVAQQTAKAEDLSMRLSEPTPGPNVLFSREWWQPSQGEEHA